jgi:hypothetical protein
MNLRSLFGSPSPTQRERWRQLKAKGKKRFILRRGVMGFGGLMFVVMTISEFVRKKPSIWPEYVFVVILNLLIWPLGGYVWGLWMWHFYEKWFSNGEQSANQ